MATARSHPVGDREGLLWLPSDAEQLFVLAPGAGAGMRHAFLEAMAAALAEVRVGTLRFEFPYQAAGKRRPDRPAVLIDAVREAVEAATGVAGDLPLFAGGKSMGGRMSSQAAAAGGLDGVHGLVFIGFPLHAAGKPGTARAEHLSAVTQPMLFLQGRRDALAYLTLLTPIVEKLGPRARMHVVDGADHSFHVLKRSGRTDAEVILELATEIAGFRSA
jgi:predicted alpha/beta-hydrolase family hydrolase